MIFRNYNNYLGIMISDHNPHNWAIHERDEKVNQWLEQRFGTAKRRAFLVYLSDTSKARLSKACKLICSRFLCEHWEIRASKRLEGNWEAKIYGLSASAVDYLSKYSNPSKELVEEDLLTQQEESETA